MGCIDWILGPTCTWKAKHLQTFSIPFNDEPLQNWIKLRFLVTRNWVILCGLFQVNLTQLTVNKKSTCPTAQEDSPAFRVIATFQQSIPSHTKAINGLHWSYARKIICWTTHPQSVWCFFVFLHFFPVFFVLGFRFKPKPVKDKDHFFSHRATEF